MDTTIQQGFLHSWTPLPVGADPWKAFAAASAGGGTPPQWTQAEKPEFADPPLDAAGTLWRCGDTADVPPSIEEARVLIEEICELETVARAAYFSSGGRGVFLIEVKFEEYSHFFIVVGRDSEIPRLGVSEENVAALYGKEPEDISVLVS